MAGPTVVPGSARPKQPTIPIHAFALVRKDGGICPVTFKLRATRDLKHVEAEGVEVGQADYRAVAEDKVRFLMGRVTPWLDDKVEASL